MQCHFMHPSSGKLFALLKKSYPYCIKPYLRRLLERISETYAAYNLHSVPLFLFAASIRKENIIFNREIAMEIMWLNGKPVFHIDDVEKHF